MKKPIIPVILCLLPLLAAFFPAGAQTNQGQNKPPRFGIDIDGGLTVPTGKSFNSIFYTGFDMSLGFKIAVLNNKRLWIKPLGGATIYNKKYTGVDKGLVESFDDYKAGLEFQYMALQAKKFSFYPLLRVTHNWCKNYFSKTYDYNATTNSQTIAISDNFLKGTGFAADAGIMITRKYWFLKIDYDYFKPTLDTNPDFIKAVLAQGYVVNPSSKFNCSTFNIGLGINFNFR